MTPKQSNKKVPFIGTVTPIVANGDYPVKQIIIVNMDSILAPILNPLIKNKYGEMDIIHQMSIKYKSTENKFTDLEKLLMTSKGVISTCWTIKRTSDVLKQYIEARGWTDLTNPVRIYVMGWYQNDPNWIRP